MKQRILELPPVKEVQVQEKRVVQNPDISTLQPQQRAIFDSCMSEFLDSDIAMAVLKGYAGTGKTYLTSMLVEYLLYNHTKYKIAMTAPTNKAVKVLVKAGSFQNPNLEYSTIHSLLGLREKIDGYGRQSFVQINKAHAKVNEYNILIIDETSMLADDLFDLLIPYTEVDDLKIIYVGDPAQIPPVGGDDSKPFTKKEIDAYGMLEWKLTQIMRQAEDNPIINITMQIRDALARPIILPVREDAYDPETMDGVYFFTGADRELFYEVIKTYFKSENFKQDADFMKIIAWTNKTVNLFNDIVRKMLYGAGVPKICEGEKLIATKPITKDDEEGQTVVLFHNNDDFEVVSYEVKKGTIKGFEFTYYDTLVRGYSVSDGTVEKKIRIIHEDSQDDLQLVLDHYKELALAEKRGSWEAAKKWEEFYRFQEVFANVTYNYAITAHKAQGSTYDNVMIMEEDMDKNRKVKERNRIKYTAFTRPVHKLMVVGA